MFESLGQAIAIAALVSGGIIRAGDTFVVPGQVCSFDGERVNAVPRWVTASTFEAMVGKRPPVVVGAFCRASRQATVVS